MNLQRTAGQVDAGATLAQAQAVAGHERGAGTRAAGEGGTRATFPDPHQQMLGAEHLHEMHVGFGRERWMNLKSTAEALQIDLVNRIHRDHHMGIAHAGSRHSETLAIHVQFPLGESGSADCEGCGHLFGKQEGSSHVDADRAVIQQLGNDASRQGVDLPGAAGAITITVRQEPCQAPDAIAAHLRFGAVRIEDAHAQLTTGHRRQRQDDAVASHAEAAVAQLNHQLRG